MNPANNSTEETTPVTKGMLYHLQIALRERERLLRRLNDPPYTVPPLPGEIDIPGQCFSYMNLPAEMVLKIRQLAPGEQQMALRIVLENIIAQTDKHIRSMEDAISNGTELMHQEENNNNKPPLELPGEIRDAAGRNDIEMVLNWLGPTPIPEERINATNLEKMGRTLRHEAQFEGNTGLMHSLLQYGANVNSKSALGSTPLQQSCSYPRLHEAALVLLEWGAEKDIMDILRGDVVKGVDFARRAGNKILERLLESPLGGRRCEIVGLKARSDLNGMTCVATKYLPDVDRYVVHIEEEDNQEAAKVRITNLIRRDRTPQDCGVHYHYTGTDPTTSGNMIGGEFVKRFVPSKKRKVDVDVDVQMK